MSFHETGCNKKKKRRTPQVPKASADSSGGAEVDFREHISHDDVAEPEVAPPRSNSRPHRVSEYGRRAKSVHLASSSVEYQISKAPYLHRRTGKFLTSWSRRTPHLVPIVAQCAVPMAHETIVNPDAELGNSAGLWHRVENFHGVHRAAMLLSCEDLFFVRFLVWTRGLSVVWRKCELGRR